MIEYQTISQDKPNSKSVEKLDFVKIKITTTEVKLSNMLPHCINIILINCWKVCDEIFKIINKITVMFMKGKTKEKSVKSEKALLKLIWEEILWLVQNY